MAPLMNSRDRVLSYLASFASGNPDDVVRHVTDDFDNQQVGELGTSCQGRDTYRDRLTTFLADFKGLRYETETVIAEADRVAVVYKMSCRYADKPIAMQGVMIMTLRDGLIASRADYWDGMSFLKQTE